MLFICFIIASLILIITLISVFFHRYQFNKSTQIMLIGIIGIITTLIFPMYKCSYDPFTSILFSAIYSLRALSGCQSVDVSHKVLIEGWLYYGYYALLYLAFIIAPILTTGFLVSIFGNMGDKIRYKFLLGKSIHVFSNLNESSIALCESIESSQTRFIFCNTQLNAKEKDSSIVKRARKKGAVILNKPETELKITKKDIHFYQINENKDYNITSTISLLEKYRNNKDLNIHITTFSSGVTSELLLDSAEKGNIRVKLFDETKYTCYSLLDYVPLFESAINNKISALIVGCDYTGLEMLKAIIWCGQISKHELEINIIDKQADLRKHQFLRDHTDINLSDYGINFINADIQTDEFERNLDKYCNDTNYIIVATGDDNLNIDTAIYLRKYFLRKDQNNFSNKPQINLRVRNQLKNKQIDILHNKDMQKYALYSFGNINKTYSIANLTSIHLEKLAIGVHLAYYGVLDGSKEEMLSALDSYYSKEYNQRSSFATALHIKYKLFSCGIKGLSGDKISNQQIEEFIKKIQDPLILESLAKLEHRRWNAFMLTEGFKKATMQDVKNYCHTMGQKTTHVHHLAKLHPTIIDWDDLDAASAQISSIINKQMDFKQSDFFIIQEIPNILKFQNSNFNYWG